MSNLEQNDETWTIYVDDKKYTTITTGAESDYAEMVAASLDFINRELAKEDKMVISFNFKPEANNIKLWTGKRLESWWTL